MKVLWVTNTLFEYHRTMMGGSPAAVTGGGWLNAAYSASMGVENLQLHIVTVAGIPERKTGECDGNMFYILPGGGSRNYDIDSQENRHLWEALRREVQPDVVIIWGTETRAAYLAAKVMKGIPMAIYMQGVMSAISCHFYEGVPHKYQCRTIRDYLNKFDKSAEYNHFSRQAALEAEMFKMADAVIVENDWCEDMCHVENPNLRVFRNDLPIRDVFYHGRWSLEKMEPYTIFTNAGGYPIKGHHILFEALATVKKQYPNFKCYLPGEKLDTFKKIKRRTGYTSYLERLIEENALQNNVIYTGVLTTEQMVEHLEQCNTYVMPSIVENHSSSLIEAMIVGAPCVTSLVGGIASLVKPGIDALLYNSMDADSLAGCIMRVFSNSDFAQKLSDNSVAIRQRRSQLFGKEMLRIYTDLFNGE
jgi:glycosyltransferase involved in cell wall biosynthesis